MPTIATLFHVRAAPALVAIMLSACSTTKPVIAPSSPAAPPQEQQASAPVAASEPPEVIDNTVLASRAQTHLDAGEFADAIIDAQTILQSDPGNILANRIIALSGLRLTRGAVDDLGKKNVSVPIKSEAAKLAKLMRDIESQSPAQQDHKTCDELLRKLNICPKDTR
jgi:hypothetical protein